MVKKYETYKILSKSITIYANEKALFNGKNSYWYSKSADFWLDIISKINCIVVVIISYMSLKLRSHKVKSLWSNFK